MADELTPEEAAAMERYEALRRRDDRLIPSGDGDRERARQDGEIDTEHWKIENEQAMDEAMREWGNDKPEPRIRLEHFPAAVRNRIIELLDLGDIQAALDTITRGG